MRHNTTAQTNLLSCFIKGVSFSDVDLAVQGLISAAESAFDGRRLEAVEAAGMALMQSGLSPSLVGTGAYFVEVSGRRADPTERARLLELAMRFAPAPIRSRAIIALGSLAGKQSDTLTQIQLYRDALRHSADARSFVEANRAVAVAASAQQQHRAALETLLGVERFVRLASSVYVPAVYYNSLAEEFRQAGQIESARQALSIAEGSPVAPLVPEIAETRADIERDGAQSVTRYFPGFAPDVQRKKQECVKYLLGWPRPAVIEAMHGAMEATR